MKGHLHSGEPNLVNLQHLQTQINPALMLIYHGHNDIFKLVLALFKVIVHIKNKINVFINILLIDIDVLSILYKNYDLTFNFFECLLVLLHKH